MAMCERTVTAETLSFSRSILAAVRMAVAAELHYEKATGCGRKFGITGEVGEILVCQALGMRLVKDPRAEGFDAVDAKGLRVQIKTRRSESGDLPREAGRLSRFSSHDFDYALMGILSRDYRLVEIWKADFAHLKPVIAKQKRANPTIRQFKAVGSRVYP